MKENQSYKVPTVSRTTIAVLTATFKAKLSLDPRSGDTTSARGARLS